MIARLGELARAVLGARTKQKTNPESQNSGPFLVVPKEIWEPRTKFWYLGSKRWVKS